MPEGTLYPLLSRLRAQGLVSTRLEESSEGPARKYYSLTKEGRKNAALMKAYLDDLNESVHALRQKGVTVCRSSPNSVLPRRRIDGVREMRAGAGD